MNRCFESAWYISTCSGLVDEKDLSLFDTDAMTVYDVFEGFVCFWFIACRMNNAWIPYLKYGDCNSKDLRERIRFMLVLYTKEVRRNASNQLITKAMAGMLEEMEEVANTGVRRGFESISG
ncbi:hypothetical protein BCR33DRAFT_712987, partial [Rhizoclosmatium globosum]